MLWICGPAGVGKSTVSWRLYTELASSGVHVAFADSDQLCMCYPAPAGDPGRQHIKALNIGAMIPNLRSAGAQCVIVNGVLGPAGLETGLLPDARVTICRLRASGDSVERRFIARHGRRDDMDELLQEIRDEVRLMDESSFADACVDTTDVPAGDVPGLVRAACKDWPGFTGRLEEAAGRLSVRRGLAIGGRELAGARRPPPRSVRRVPHRCRRPSRASCRGNRPVGRRRRGHRHNQPLTGRVSRHNPQCHRLA